MKTMFKKNGKRVLSAALCLLMAVMSLPLSAFAWTSEEGRSCTSSFGDYYVGSDGGYYRSQATMHTLVYNNDGSTYVKSYSSGNAKRKYLMTDNSGTHQVYCVESGIDFNTGNTYTSKSGQNSSYFKNLPTDAQFGVMMALMYGWHEGKSSPVAGTNADDYAYATQSIIWEYQQQLRTSPADLHSANGIPADMYYSSIKGRPAEKCYNWILSQMADHYTIPSFAARNQSKANTYTLKYNPDTQKYSLTIEDTNNTLSNIKFSASGISVSRSGNKYTFTSDKMITSPVTVSAQKQVNLNTDDMLIWGCVGKQTMISGASDPVYFYFKIDTETYGTGHIKKTSEDGVVSGIKFNISGNGVNKTVTTKADGTVDISLMPGVYTVTEQSIDRYEPQSVQRVTIVSGHSSTVTFNNTLKRGNLEIIKNSEDNLVEGVKFHLYGTSLSGLPVDEYAVTDAKGVAKFSNVLISGDTPYVVEEIDTAVRYVVPASQTAPIEWEKVTSRTFVNVLKKFNVTVTKSDVETGTEQGDASLAGAVYGIYKGEELIDTYTTDNNGQFMVSLRGLRKDATLFNEIVIDVNTMYFERNGGYEYAKQFYEEAFHFIEEKFGTDNVISAVMHADEINVAATEELGKEVYHYHLHAMVLPVVEKEILWSKRCKDEKLRGTVKEIVHQISHSKKWKSDIPLTDEKGNPLLRKNGKPMFRASYSILQDELFNHMTERGFKGFQRGEYGSTAEHLTSLQYQIKQDKERLEKLQKRIQREQIKYEPARNVSKTYNEIDSMGQKTITGKMAISKEDYSQLTALAKEGITSRAEISELEQSANYYRQKYFDCANALERMKTKYNELKEKCRPFLQALEHFPEVAKLFNEKVKQLFSFKEAQERAEKEAREKERQERIKARRNKRGMER